MPKRNPKNSLYLLIIGCTKKNRGIKKEYSSDVQVNAKPEIVCKGASLYKELLDQPIMDNKL